MRYVMRIPKKSMLPEYCQTRLRIFWAIRYSEGKNVLGIDLKTMMQLPNMACKSLHALTPARLHPHPPISRISSICSDLHLLQSFLPQSLCPDCSHLLEHSSLSQSPSLSLHIKVSVHILRQSLWPPWVGQPPSMCSHSPCAFTVLNTGYWMFVGVTHFSYLPLLL